MTQRELTLSWSWVISKVLIILGWNIVLIVKAPLEYKWPTVAATILWYFCYHIGRFMIKKAYSEPLGNYLGLLSSFPLLGVALYVYPGNVQIYTIVFGVGLNAFAIFSNQGYMPVFIKNSRYTLVYEEYVCFSDKRSVKVWWLGDWIKISNIMIFSFGDIFIYSGMISFSGNYFMSL